MRQFKKKTISLCLASAITVLGAFGADNYENSLVSMKINQGSNGLVKLTAFTRRPYSMPLKTERIDNDTYYINLPETYSEIITMPEIANYENIESIQVSTFPYTPESKGYTRIYIKTKGSPLIQATPSLYITDMSNSSSQIVKKQDYNNKPKKTESYWDKHELNEKKAETPKVLPSKNYSKVNVNYSNKKKNVKKPVETPKKEVINQNIEFNYDEKADFSKDRLIATISVFLITALIMFIYFVSKDKMAAVVGENGKYDLDEDEDKNKKNRRVPDKQKKRIRRTINKLDELYSAQNVKRKINIITGEHPEQNNIIQEYDNKNNNLNIDVVNQEQVIVDLDDLYREKEQSKNIQSDTESKDVNNQIDDLADFLNNFSFEEEPVEEKQHISYDEEFYDKVLSKTEVKFTDNDIKKINNLLQDEVSEDTLNNIDQFAPAKPSAESQVAKLENLLAEYTVKQNLNFSRDDVEAIKKLMNVELDPDFISDLKTNPIRTNQVAEEIKSLTKEKPLMKKSEILTLNVKDLLPDLTNELKKQGNRRIESNAKPETIYFSEGYEVQKLLVNDELANISRALLNNKDEQKFRPSDDLPIAIDGYEVSTIHIKDQLPDLKDIKKLSKQEEVKEKVFVDEKSLLASIANVTFKPFYEEETESEPENIIIQEPIVDINEETVPENIIAEEINNTNQDFSQEEIVNEKEIEIEVQKPIEIKEPIEIKKQKLPKEKKDDEAQKLIKLIEEQQIQRENKRKNIEKLNEKIVENIKTAAPIQKTKAELTDNNIYNIVSSAECSSGVCCNLVKESDGYTVIGKFNNNSKKLKHYDTLRTENIQTRMHKKLDNGIIQYLVRVSIHKFIINVTNNGMEFVMDLC